MRVVIQEDYNKMCKWAADYIAAKIAEGKATKAEYADKIAERQTWRDDINAAQDEIARLEALEPDPDMEPDDIVQE